MVSDRPHCINKANRTIILSVESAKFVAGHGIRRTNFAGARCSASGEFSRREVQRGLSARFEERTILCLVGINFDDCSFCSRFFWCAVGRLALARTISTERGRS